jgi:hypothetical protein
MFCQKNFKKRIQIYREQETIDVKPKNAKITALGRNPLLYQTFTAKPKDSEKYKDSFCVQYGVFRIRKIHKFSSKPRSKSGFLQINVNALQGT